MTASIDTIKAAISSQGGLAKGNKFLVELPNIGGSMRAMNTLCNSANMPGKQITTVDRRIGMEFEKIAYGYAVDDVTMTFYMPNSYLPKKYFDTWRSIIINENSQVAAYKSSYARPIRIHQLRQTLPSNAKNIKVISEGNIKNMVNLKKIVTYSGSVSYEAVSMGIKPIIISSNSLYNYNKNLTHKPKNLNDYKQLILSKNLKKFRVEKKNIIEAKKMIFLNEKIMTLKKNLPLKVLLKVRLN